MKGIPRGKEDTKVAEAKKKLAEMNEQEQKEAFEEWKKSREGRQTQNTAKRQAIRSLIKAHQPEYNALLKKAGGKVKE